MTSWRVGMFGLNHFKFKFFSFRISSSSANHMLSLCLRTLSRNVILICHSLICSRTHTFIQQSCCHRSYGQSSERCWIVTKYATATQVEIFPIRFVLKMCSFLHRRWIWIWASRMGLFCLACIFDWVVLYCLERNVRNWEWKNPIHFILVTCVFACSRHHQEVFIRQTEIQSFILNINKYIYIFRKTLMQSLIDMSFDWCDLQFNLRSIWLLMWSSIEIKTLLHWIIELLKYIVHTRVYTQRNNLQYLFFILYWSGYRDVTLVQLPLSQQCEPAGSN